MSERVPLKKIQIMDLGFALQAHSLRALAHATRRRFVDGYNAVPAEVDAAVAREALTTLSSVETE